VRLAGSDVNEDSALNASWILASIDAVTPDAAQRMLLSRYATVRAFGVKHVSENTPLRNAVRRTFQGLLRVEQSPVVAMAYASGLQKLPSATLLGPLHVAQVRGTEMRRGDLDGFEILRLLTERSHFATQLDSDRSLRLMTWHGAIPHDAHGIARSSCEQLNAFCTRYTLSQALGNDPTNAVLEFHFRMITLQALVLPLKDTELHHIRSQLTAILTAVAGYSQLVEPKNWTATRTQLLALDDTEVSEAVQRLSVLFGDGTGLPALHDLVNDRNGDGLARTNAIETLAMSAIPDSVSVILSVLNDRAVYVPAAKALASFDDPRIPAELLKHWSSLRHGGREAALDTLCSRSSYAVELATALDDGRVSADDLTATHVRQLLAFNDPTITKTTETKWGVINDSSEAKIAAIAKWKETLTPDVLANADLERGAALFKKSCAACHKLYGDGGKIGPDLTGSNRGNLDYLLGNVIDPSAVVPKQFTTSIIALQSGRIVTGVVVAETDQTVTVQTDKEVKVIAVSDIDERTRTGKSLMPDGLLDSLNEQQVIDLLAFVMHRRR